MKAVSPLRYSGGKNWLFFKQYLCLPLALANNCKRLIEPFAGSAKVSLTLLHYGLIERAVLVELEPRVAAFWKKALYTDDIIERLEAFDPSDDSAILAVLKNPDRDIAWWALVKSRVAKNGNLRGGNMDDLDSRFGKEGLLQQLRIVRQLSPRIEFIEGDGIEVLDRYRDDPEASAFLDPPYVGAGEELYIKGESPHERLFEVLPHWQGRWVMTYDQHPEILGRTPDFMPPGGCFIGARMKTGEHQRKHELVFISKNLAGLDDIKRWYYQGFFAPGQTGIRYMQQS